MSSTPSETPEPAAEPAPAVPETGDKTDPTGERLDKLESAVGKLVQVLTGQHNEPGPEEPEKPLTRAEQRRTIRDEVQRGVAAIREAEASKAEAKPDPPAPEKPPREHPRGAHGWFRRKNWELPEDRT